MFLWLLSLEKDWRTTTEFNLLHREEPHNSPMRKHFETETAVQLQLSLFRQLSQFWNVRQFPESTKKKSFLPFLLTLRGKNTVWCMTLIRKSTRYPHKYKWSNRVTHIHKAGRYFVNRQDKEGGNHMTDSEKQISLSALWFYWKGRAEKIKLLSFRLFYCLNDRKKILEIELLYCGSSPKG